MSIPLDAISILGGMPTFEQAQATADRLSRKWNEPRYVICEAGCYYALSFEDLSTFFTGHSILYATA